MIWYLGIHIETGQNYWILVWPMIIIDALGNPLIKVLEKTGKIQGGGRIYKHSIAGKIKYALQVVLITLLWIKEVFPYEYEEVAIYFVLSIATVLAFFSVFCKVKPSTCEKIWRTSNGS